MVIYSVTNPEEGRMFYPLISDFILIKPNNATFTEVLSITRMI